MAETEERERRVMGSEREYSIEHKTHPGHPLIYSSGSSGDFICDGCNKPGNGSRYQCVPCDFVLHELCATCPATVSLAVHPSHDLKLVFLGDLQLLLNCFCDICGTEIDCLQFYRCEPCKFEAHPLCTQLPEQMRHPLHPDHLLRLQPLPPGMCSVCKTPCATSRGYACQLCDFHVHLPCLLNSSLPKWSSFLDILMKPEAVFLIVILACFVFILLMSTTGQHNLKGFSIHSVYYPR